jgi:hypothetical protein
MTQDEDKPDTPDDAGAFDCEAARSQLHQTEAALREVVRRKRQAAQARARAEQAHDPRQFALNSLLAIEDELFALFDSGETLAEMLAYLKESMPGVPVADLRRALKTIRQRRVRTAPSPTKPDTRSAPPATSASGRKAPAAEAALTQPTAKRAASQPSPRSPATQTDPGTRSRIHPTLPNVELPDWADWSDQAADESDADYIFRKALEMPPETQRKFIGEHKR